MSVALNTQSNSIIDYLEKWALIEPDKCLYEFIGIRGNDQQSYTYRTFNEHSRNVAYKLARNHGLKSRDRALLAYPPGLDLVVAFFACVRAGVIPVPVYPPTPMGFDAGIAKLHAVATDCQAKVVLSTNQLSEFVQQKFTCRTSGSQQQTLMNLKDLVWIATDDVIEDAPQDFRNTIHSDLFLQYTSGSTGNPRGVIVSHENIIQNATATLDHVPIGVSWLPQYRRISR